MDFCCDVLLEAAACFLAFILQNWLCDYGRHCICIMLQQRSQLKGRPHKGKTNSTTKLKPCCLVAPEIHREISSCPLAGAAIRGSHFMCGVFNLTPLPKHRNRWKYKQSQTQWAVTINHRRPKVYIPPLAHHQWKSVFWKLLWCHLTSFTAAGSCAACSGLCWAGTCCLLRKMQVGK